jgi:hypothetical protein
LLRSYQSISPGPRLCLRIFRNKIRFNREELWAPCPTPNLEDHPLSAVCDCLLNIFAATLHIGGSSSLRNPRTRHALVTGIRLLNGQKIIQQKYMEQDWQIRNRFVNNKFQFYVLCVECFLVSFASLMTRKRFILLCSSVICVLSPHNNFWTKRSAL